MESEKMAIVKKIQEKGMSVRDAAKAIEFDPMILELYLKEDAYPVPKRILDKVDQALNA